MLALGSAWLSQIIPGTHRDYKRKVSKYKCGVIHLDVRHTAGGRMGRLNQVPAKG